MAIKKKKENRINPESFYRKNEGVYHQDPKEKKLNISDKVDIPPKTEDKISNREEPIPKPFNSKEYKQKENKILENKGADVRVYNKSSYNLLLSILIGVLIVFGLFFVWSVSNDKFKTDFDCPDLKCEKAELSCPAVKIPDCICDQTLSCPIINNSDIVDAINNLTWQNNTNCSS